MWIQGKGQNLPNIQTPQPAKFTSVDINQFTPKSSIPSTPTNPLLNSNNSIEEQNRQILQKHNMLPQATNARQVQQLADIERDLIETNFYRETVEWMNKTKSYREALTNLLKMNPNSFSLTTAEYLVENAFFDNQLPYKQFETNIKNYTQLIKQILKREGLSTKNNTALNYGIQKLFSQHNTFYNNKTKQSVTAPAFKYDLNDYMGEKDYTKMFVSKLLFTGSGQCHSMPLLYLILAEQVGAKAWLSLAPQHSYIQFPDNNGRLISFETTNGNIVSGTWLAQSGYINAKALKNKTYLDTLSQRNLYAHCLADLLLGYEAKYGYDDFAEQITQKILQINPNNLTARLTQSNVQTQTAMKKIKAVGTPKVVDLPNYPEAYKAYLAMHTIYNQIDDLGYQDMPKEAYQSWLKSIEKEKKKQATQQLKQQIKKEIEDLKRAKINMLPNNIRN